MQYINCGAQRSGEWVSTKAELIRLIRAGDTKLDFRITSDFVRGAWISISQLSPDITLIVTGPNPYNKRVWYANVSITDEGKIKVS